MHTSKIIVTRAVTKEEGKYNNKTWNKREYTVEVSLNKEDNPEQAKEIAETLIQAWMKKDS